MNKIKIIFGSLMLIAAFALNSFAAEETKKEIKSFSPELATKLETALQSEKEKQKQLSTENNVFFSNEKNTPIHLGQKIIMNKNKQTYTLTLNKGDIQGCELVKTSKEWFSTRENTYNKDVERVHGFYTRNYVKFITKSPAIEYSTGRIIPGDNISITIEKHIETPNISFQTEVFFFPNKIGKVFIGYDIGDGIRHYKAIADLNCVSLQGIYS